MLDEDQAFGQTTKKVPLVDKSKEEDEVIRRLLSGNATNGTSSGTSSSRYTVFIESVSWAALAAHN